MIAGIRYRGGRGVFTFLKHSGEPDKLYQHFQEWADIMFIEIEC